jgi:hypothetical protein
VLLFGITRYSDVVWQQEVYRYGVSIRVLLEIFSDKLDFNLSLPTIAAKVELGVVRASSQLLIRGYAGDISASLPSWQSFDVDSYADYQKSVNELQHKILGDSANIRPELLSTTFAQKLVDPSKHTAKRGWLTILAI